MAGLNTDTLYLACTRPAMRWGVPLEGFVLNVAISWIGGMILGSPLWWSMFLVFHLPMRALANKNPNFFRELRMWYLGSGAGNRRHLAAAPARRALSAERLASSV